MVENVESKSIKQWQALIEDAKNDNEWQKLNRANQFINNAYVESDNKLWGKADHWATPLEFIRKNAGDCENFAIAKYFTLKSIEVAETKLVITHAIIKKTRKAHMVLLYRETESSLLVLDKNRRQITLLSQQADLEAIYGFNESDLWIMKTKFPPHQGWGCQQHEAMDGA